MKIYVYSEKNSEKSFVVSVFNNWILETKELFPSASKSTDKSISMPRFWVLMEVTLGVWYLKRFYTLRKYKFLAGRQFDVARNFRNKV